MIIVFLVVMPFVMIGIRKWRVQRNADEVRRGSERYAGMTGSTIRAFDEITDRWIAEMTEEAIETTLQKLTDAAEYINFGYGIVSSGDFFSFATEDWREKSQYSKDIDFIFGAGIDNCVAILI